MRLFRIFMPVLALAPACLAQLTPAQKTADFMQLVGLYAKNYAPYELKRDLFNFDLYNIQPWLDQINKSTDDVTYYDILTKYVASLHDFHDGFFTPSDFEAWLHMDADVYGGKVLIADIDRAYLPSRSYQFAIGDEIVSIDGVAAADLLQQFTPYAVNGSGNTTSQARIAAATMTDRLQEIYPKATQIGDNATVVIKRQNGDVETYTIPWDKTGTALARVGPVPSPHAVGSTEEIGTPRVTTSRRGSPRHAGNPWGIWDGPPAQIAPDPVPAYMVTQRKLQYGRAFMPASRPGSIGLFPFGNPAPAFNPPAGFKLRLGARATDEFVSGTFPVGKSTVGYIRIYTMEPNSESAAIIQFVNEVLFFQQNTDGLVVDVMANGGGFGCYSQELAQLLTPYTFRGLAENYRATEFWVQEFSITLTQAQAQGAPQWVINLYTSYLGAAKDALAQSRGNTGPLPTCGPSFDANPITDSRGNTIAYTKPILVLTDNFSGSAAEIFAMFLQDSKRATLFGTRTAGGGGTVLEFDNNATDYSVGTARVTESLITRAQPVATPGFPLGQYSIFYEAQGIYPDIVEDYQTLDNLLHGGATFVADFSTAISNLIQGSH